MERFSTTSALIEAVGARFLVAGPPVTALYASAGADTKPFTFTHPDFLARRGLADVPAPNVFVLVDYREQPAPAFRDEATVIETLESEPLRAGGVEMRLARVRHTSTTFAERNLAVITVAADNREIQPVWHREAWRPELFIGVCDGCRWGGNPRGACVNRLDVPAGMPQSIAETVQVPRWWITDHFTGIQGFAEMRNGDIVESADGRFPFVYRKLALLSSNWGSYAGPAMRGATIFEVERRTGQPAKL